MPKISNETQIALLQANHKTLMEEFKNYKIETNKNHEEIKSLIIDFKKEVKETLGTKADKKSQWAETFLLWVGGIITTGLIGYLGYLVVKIIEL